MTKLQALRHEVCRLREERAVLLDALTLCLDAIQYDHEQHHCEGDLDLPAIARAAIAKAKRQ